MNSDCICSNKNCPLIMRGFRPYTCVNKKFWRYSFLQGKVIVVEGNVGSGKSSSGKEMARFLSEDCGLPAVYLPEYVDIELLKEFIQNMKMYSYTFQLFMLERRAEIYRNAMLLSSRGHVVIIDRMMHGDLAFAHLHFKRGNISAFQFDNYRARMQSFGFNEPALTIFLDVSPECALRRAKKRARKGETYNLEYFQEIKDAYDEVMKTYRGNVLNIDYEEDLLVEEITTKVEEMLEKCIQFLLN